MRNSLLRDVVDGKGLLCCSGWEFVMALVPYSLVELWCTVVYGAAFFSSAGVGWNVR